LGVGFADKAATRQWVLEQLSEQRVARFPFPIRGRIPNFVGAEAAARRLVTLAPLAGASIVKANPDAPQRPVREQLLRSGIVVYVPTPRLAGGFKRLDPVRIPTERLREAAGLSGMDRWAEPVSLDALPAVDAVVTGSVAVTRSGRRCGKGHGYGDLEYAILRDLGHPPVPVLTSVHPLQVVADLPADAHDLPVHWIATPDETIEVSDPPPAPDGIDWDALPPDALEEMPVLQALHERLTSGEGD